MSAHVSLIDTYFNFIALNMGMVKVTVLRASDNIK